MLGQHSGAAAALFGVAVVQLRDAVEQGRPFDWELVDVRDIAGNDPVLLREIYRLAPLSGGVATENDLRQAVLTLAQSETQRSARSLVQTGLEIFGRAFGPGGAATPANPNPGLLLQASARLDQRDAGGVVRDLRALTGDGLQTAQPLISAAETRAAALEAIEVLMEASRTRLQTQLRSAAVAQVPAAVP